MDPIRILTLNILIFQSEASNLCYQELQKILMVFILSTYDVDYVNISSIFNDL